MNSRLSTLLAASAVGALIAGAPLGANAQQTTGLYVSGGFGVNWLQDVTSNGNGGSTDLSFKYGPAAAAALGYGLGNGFRTELELAYRRNNVDSSSRGASDGHAETWSLLGNLLYDFNTGTAFTPYVGIGIGGARTSYDSVGALAGNRRADDSSVAPAGQAIAGVSYAIDQNLKLDLSYRYFMAANSTYSTTNGGTAEVSNRNHTLLLGVRYEFGAPAPRPVAAAAPAPAPRPAAPAPAAAAPAPAPAPAPAAQLQRSYLVFFDFNRSDLTSEATRVIQQAATNAKTGNVSRIQATGHADRSGSDSYNMALSIRRANAVKDALVRAGIPANQIVVIGKGETDPLVQTQDGVREPQNRRVEILLQ